MIPTVSVVVASDTDFPQCLAGMKYLKKAVFETKIVVAEICTISDYRNPLSVLDYIKRENAMKSVDVIIAGSGCAAHLPGMLDAFLAHGLDNRRISVIGVGFEDFESARHTQAAELSISEVPDTRVIYQDAAGPFMGSDGFLRACKLAVKGNFPKLGVRKSRQPKYRTLDQALAVAEAMIKKS